MKALIIVILISNNAYEQPTIHRLPMKSYEYCEVNANEIGDSFSDLYGESIRSVITECVPTD